MNNFKSCSQWVLEQGGGNNCRVLDYGCGGAEIVKELRELGVDAYGCDVFYEGGNRSASINHSLFDKAIIKKMEGDAIPFDSNSFDFVINKMVMEHVEDIDRVLVEVKRVLKPGGAVLSIFPDISVWHEGHCGIPFLHWFSKGGLVRIYYAAAWRSIGIGYHKGNKNVMCWSRDFCEWLDKWTFYRTQQEIHVAYNKYFCDIEHIEEYWLHLRLGKLSMIVTWLPVSLQQVIVRKLSTLVFVARKSV